MCTRCFAADGVRRADETIGCNEKRGVDDGGKLVAQLLQLVECRIEAYRGGAMAAVRPLDLARLGTDDG